MQAGTAFRDITPDKPIDLGGQMHVRKGAYTHDPLTVNAAAFADGDEHVVLVSIDVCILEEPVIREMQRRCFDEHGVARDRVMIACTHTHVAPVTSKLLIGEISDAFMASMIQAVVDTVGESLSTLEEVDLYAGAGFIELLGWNRRGLHADGRCDMYHGSWQEDFAGIEGPRDGEVGVIFARRTIDDSLLLVIPSFCSHPNCVEGEKFYSADLPGAVRKVIRQSHGDDVGVVYVTGAAGDTAPSIMENNKDNRQPWRGEAGLARSGNYLGGEVLKVIAAASAAEPMAAPVLGCERIELTIAIRPWDEGFNPYLLNGGMRDFFVKSFEDWDRMTAEESPVTFPVDVVRLGDAAICMNPSELFCAFGLEIKKRSPAQVTLVSELTNGWIGYVPTAEAITRGGYSAHTGVHIRLMPDTGDQIVDATDKMLRKLFD